MPRVKLPFPTNGSNDDLRKLDLDHLRQCSLYPLLPQPLQEATGRQAHLLAYLHTVPMREVGIPDYYPKLTRDLRDLEERNLIYPVGDDVFTHIYSDPASKGDRDNYIPIEPVLTMDLEALRLKVEYRLLGMVDEIGRAETDEEKAQIILDCIDRVCTTGNGAHSKKWNWFKKRGNGKIHVTPLELEGLKYLILRDKIGLGALQPLLQDKYIEDISCSGVGHIFIEHKIFKSLKSSVVFSSHNELDDFVVWLGERIKKPVTVRNPIVDATLPDGSRINIVYGRDVSTRGSNFTIRRFSETPYSILELIEFGTLDYLMAAYLSLIIEEGMNLFVSGETASGKTTTLNALTTFILPDSKIVSIEDTPELKVPHQNWVREVSKGKESERDGGTEVTMFDLLKACLRQRPDFILVGEIRGREGNIAFQAMQTGHAVMSTFHAASVQKLIQRITGDPINVPKTYLDNLNVVIIQSTVKLPDGSSARRILSINEIVGYDSESDSFSFIEVFRWNPATDTFEFPGDMNSYLLEERIAVRRGIPPGKKRRIYAQLKRRARILERLHKEKGVTGFYELLKVLAEAQKVGVF